MQEFIESGAEAALRGVLPPRFDGPRIRKLVEAILWASPMALKAVYRTVKLLMDFNVRSHVPVASPRVLFAHLVVAVGVPRQLLHPTHTQPPAKPMHVVKGSFRLSPVRTNVPRRAGGLVCCNTQCATLVGAVLCSTCGWQASEKRNPGVPTP